MIQSILVIGAGAMGRGIAQIMAVAGFSVTLADARAGAARDGQAAVAKILVSLAERGKMDRAAADAAIERLTIVDGDDYPAEIDLVIEAIIEDLEVKRSLFRKLDEHFGAHVVLATNTSSLSVTAIAAACAHPERVAGLHFFNPVPLMRLVEIIPGLRTRPEYLHDLKLVVDRCGHIPVVAKDTPGFLVNHLGRAYAPEALRILAETIAEPATIDTIMRESFGFRMGPFELMDLIGLDVTHPAMESVYHQYYQEPRYRPQVLTARMLQGGLLGRKTGQGFYRYGEASPAAEADDGPAPSDADIFWMAPEDRKRHSGLYDRLRSYRIALDEGLAPPDAATLLIAPLGLDATTVAADRGWDPRRVIAIDPIATIDARTVLMGTIATDRDRIDGLAAQLRAAGRAVSVIADSPGFVGQRIIAMIVNIGSEVAQLGIAPPDEIDLGARFGLSYPMGPLQLGDAVGPSAVVEILDGLSRIYRDPRYRPSIWLQRRARLGLSLTTLPTA